MARRSRRRVLQAGLAVAGYGLLAGCGIVPPRAQPARVHRIGYLAPNAPPTISNGAFVEGLRNLGYVDGQIIEIVYRWAEEREERLPALAAELVGLPVDVILARGSAVRAAKADALLVLPAMYFARNRDLLLRLVAQHRLPAIYDVRSFTDAGGLMNYGANTADLGRRAATFVDKVLKGANPAELPVELSRAFDLAVNVKTAQALGLTIPRSVLDQATEVIQ